MGAHSLSGNWTDEWKDQADTNKIFYQYLTKFKVHHNLFIKLLLGSKANTVLVKQPELGMIIQQNCWKCPYPPPPPPPPPTHKNTILQKLVSWSELFIFLNKSSKLLNSANPLKILTPEQPCCTQTKKHILYRKINKNGHFFLCVLYTLLFGYNTFGVHF